MSTTKTKTPAVTNDVYQIITDKIIAKLEAGVIPWKQTWKGMEVPRNYITRKAYRGINSILLSFTDYERPYFLTFKQAQDLGGYIQKGAKQDIVTYWNFVYIDIVTGKKVDKKDVKKFPAHQLKQSAFLRYYGVFNIKYLEGVEVNLPEIKLLSPQEKNDTCQAVIDGYKNKPTIKHTNSNSAYYSPSADYINVPESQYFDGIEEYYATLFHESIHSTGHKNRLNREDFSGNKFGSKNYSKEELVAELGTAFLCQHTGIINKTLDNSASYINGWLKVLNDDKRLVIEAAGKAQRAVDHILGNTFEEEGEE